MSKEFTFNFPPYKNYYEVLGCRVDVKFTELKKAYYKRVKECHPDHFPNNRQKEEEFKVVAQAMNVLSDPYKRQDYNSFLQQGGKPKQGPKTVQKRSAPVIMDSEEDDALEEWFVGAEITNSMSLATLFTDLERQERFILFREGKTLYKTGNAQKALQLFLKCYNICKVNILYNYYVAMSASKLRKWGLADKHFKICIRLGDERTPSQKLLKIRKLLYALRQNHGGLLGKVKNYFTEAPPPEFDSPEEEMVERTGRVFEKMLVQNMKQNRVKNKQLGSSTRKQLGPKK
ncbi:MAG: J domain-containing protein [Lentisphaeria bacterium]|nr:J domain-containing protein [Lentisphaeria bacterium]